MGPSACAAAGFSAQTRASKQRWHESSLKPTSPALRRLALARSRFTRSERVKRLNGGRPREVPMSATQQHVEYLFTPTTAPRTLTLNHSCVVAVRDVADHRIV